MLPTRLLRLPVLPGTSVRVAVGLRARLAGLALLALPEDEFALLLPRTRSIHTLGMRFALDLHWLGPDGRPVRIDRGVPPFRVRSCRRAKAVIECPSNCPR